MKNICKYYKIMEIIKKQILFGIMYITGMINIVNNDNTNYITISFTWIFGCLFIYYSIKKS